MSENCVKPTRLYGIASRFWAIAQLIGVLWLAACGAQALDSAEGDAGAGGTGTNAGGMGGARDFAIEVDEVPPRRLSESLEQTLITPPVQALACTSNPQCPTGACVDGFCCDTRCDNKCMACSAAKKGSGVDGICGSIAYDTDPDNDCPYGACDGKNQCKNYNGFSCTAPPQCLSNYCVDGVCCGNICMGACQACTAAKKGSGSDGVCGSIAVNTDPDNECNPGECNGSGACNASPQPTSANGASCSSAAQCASGFCADGVCCDSWCLGTCQACTAAKKNQGVDGVCGPIANDKDPDDECWGGACNGAGVCKQYNGVPCTNTSQCLSGYCVDGFCCGNVCTGMCYACSETKKGQGYDGVCGPMASGKDPDNECNPGECNGSGTCNQPQTPQADGTTCVSGAQCASGNCIDGYCCNTTCTGLCQACSAARKGSGANGTCGNIATETDPDVECNGGKCDGQGACRYYNGASCTSTNQCFSNYCVDGFCCGNVCTGTCYACSAAKKGQGYDGACGPIANANDPDNECNPGECNGSGACNQAPVLQANGTACTLATQCVSGFCVDGFCCGTACTGSCQACSATKKGNGTNGACGNIKYDTDPDNECYAGSCSGSGTCQYYNGVPCTTTSNCLSSYCVDGVCCGNVCTGTCMACAAAKKGSGNDGSCGPIAQWSNPDNECSTGTCNGSGACMALLGNASACTSNVQCTSGFCFDGVCCNSACGASCFACNLVGSVGTCTAEPMNVCSVCTAGVGLPGAPTAASYGLRAKLADLNNDGFPDLVDMTPSYQGQIDYVYGTTIFVSMSNGDGTFGDPVNYAVNNGPYMVEFADFNGDGSMDIVVATHETNHEKLSVLLNNGNGTFAPHVDYATTEYVYALVAADLSGDGLPDLAVTTSISVRIMLNNGNGVFALVDVKSSLQASHGLVAADVNGDGRKDLAAVGDYNSAVRVWINQGTGVLNNGVDYSIAYHSSKLIAADLNGDGKLDLVTAHDDVNLGASIVLNNGNGTFGSYVSYAQAQMVGDVNADGNPDLLGAKTSTNLLSVRMNQGNGTFGALVQYPTGTGPTLMPPRDLNGDGKIDLATANASGGTVSVFINQGTGTFGAKTDYWGAWGSNGGYSEDLNGDGLIDLAVVMDKNGVVPLLNVGNGVFGPDWREYAGGTGAAAIVAADLNADGLPDVATSDPAGNSISILLNQGNGTLGTHVEYPGANGPRSIVAADVNADGAVDLAVGNSIGSTASVFINQGNGTFAPNVDYSTGLNPNGIAVADLNGDGRIDLVVSNNGSMTFSVLLNQSNGTFAAKVDYATGSKPYGVNAADLNGDGFIDLVVPLGTTNTAGVFFNQGNGTFGPKVAIATGSNCIFAMASDMNGDGKKDLVFGNKGSNGAGVVINQGNGTFGAMVNYGVGAFTSGEAAVLADINGDNVPDIAVAGGGLYARLNQGNGLLGTFLSYATYGTTNAIAAGDFDGDGRMDLVTTYGNGIVSVRRSRCLH